MNEIAASPPASVNPHDTPSLGRQMLNKVPEVTIYFWIIKILCTTVGETAADLMNEELGLGLTNTTYIMSAALIAILIAQFRSRGCADRRSGSSRAVSRDESVSGRGSRSPGARAMPPSWSNWSASARCAAKGPCRMLSSRARRSGSWPAPEPGEAQTAAGTLCTPLRPLSASNASDSRLESLAAPQGAIAAVLRFLAGGYGETVNARQLLLIDDPLD
jgi:hypothetical protein